MAIYRLSTKIIGTKSGKGGAGRAGSAVKAAAYRSGESLTRKAEENKCYDFTRKQDVVHTEIIAPAHAPDWCNDREKLWNAVEAGEKRKDAQFAREVSCALPRELTLDQQKTLVQGFVKEHFTSKGMIADIAIHHAKASDGGGNPHAHIMLTMRDLEHDGFGKKNRDWNKKALLQDWRQSWAHHANIALEQAGHDQRIDDRTLKEQGIDRPSPVHDGMVAHQMRERGMDAVNAGDIARQQRAQQQQVQSRLAWQQSQQRPVQKGSSGVGGFSLQDHSWQFRPMEMEQFMWEMMGQDVWQPTLNKEREHSMDAMHYAELEPISQTRELYGEELEQEMDI